MNHPDLDRLTAWVHECLDPEDAAALKAHVVQCGECREMVDRLREESFTLAAELAPEHRLKDLRERLLRRAEAGDPPAVPRRALLWQAPLAAALLLGLVALLAWRRRGRGGRGAPTPSEGESANAGTAAEAPHIEV